MKEGPNVAPVAALIGDPARCNILVALLDGRALTASELAAVAGVTKQTASSHLGKLMAGGLIGRESQGRHRYFRLADADVAHAIEGLLHIADRGPGKRARTGPSDPALRKARICYDHLAGEMGVEMLDKMIQIGWIQQHDDALILTSGGEYALSRIGLRISELPKSKRPMCRSCLDWSARRHHMAGRVGAALLSRFFELQWARRSTESRVISFTSAGYNHWRTWLEQDANSSA